MNLKKRTLLLGCVFAAAMAAAVPTVSAEVNLVVSYGERYGHSHRSHRRGHEGRRHDRHYRRHRHEGHGHGYRQHRHKRKHKLHRHHRRSAGGWWPGAAVTLGYIAGRSERRYALHDDAYEYAGRVPYRETVIWNDGRAAGQITPIRSSSTRSQRQCREFQHRVRIDGEAQRAYGTACRQPDGSWQIVD